MSGTDLREAIWEAIGDEWDSNRPEDGVGTADSRDVYQRLASRGVYPPPGAMNEVLEDFHAEGRIRGSGYGDREGIQKHGARHIIEPEWEAW